MMKLPASSVDAGRALHKTAVSHFPRREVMRMWRKRGMQILRFLVLTGLIPYVLTIDVR